MARFASLRRAAPVALSALFVAATFGAGCTSRRMTGPCEAPCAAPAPAPCAAPCAAVEAPPCPPSTSCGEVWCRVWVPPVTCMEAETYCVKPAQKKCVWIAPEYGTRPKLTCTAPASLKETRRPAVWTTKKREVLVQPAQEGWRRICCPPVEDPCGCPMPQECYEKTCCPAVYGEEACPVCLRPEVACLSYQPAQYRVEEERFCLSPGRCEEIEEPATFDTRFRQVCVQPGHWEWRRNTSCEPPPPGPIAIQVEMKDRNERGEEEGIFRVGSVVRYDLDVIADKSQQSVKNIRVIFALPKELEFVGGGGENGVTISGSGTSAQTNVFTLPVDGRMSLHALARVKDAKPGTNVQFTATVQTAEGVQLAVETESTTIGGGGSTPPE